MSAPAREEAGGSGPELPRADGAGKGRRTAGEYAAPARPRRLPTATYPGWEAIYEDNVGRIHRLMFSKTGNRPDSEDLTSQVFLTALPSLRPTATIGEVRAYLLATARTVLAGHWQRTLGRQVTVIDVDRTDLEDYAQPSPARPPSRAPEHLGRILEALPERHRRILTLRFLLGYSIREAAAELGVTVANAKVLQHRALRKAAGLEPPAPGPRDDERGHVSEPGPAQRPGRGSAHDPAGGPRHGPQPGRPPGPAPGQPGGKPPAHEAPPAYEAPSAHEAPSAQEAPPAHQAPPAQQAPSAHEPGQAPEQPPGQERRP